MASTFIFLMWLHLQHLSENILGIDHTLGCLSLTDSCLPLVPPIGMSHQGCMSWVCTPWLKSLQAPVHSLLGRRFSVRAGIMHVVLLYPQDLSKHSVNIHSMQEGINYKKKKIKGHSYQCDYAPAIKFSVSHPIQLSVPNFEGILKQKMNERLKEIYKMTKAIMLMPGYVCYSCCIATQSKTQV